MKSPFSARLMPISSWLTFHRLALPLRLQPGFHRSHSVTSPGIGFTPPTLEPRNSASRSAVTIGVLSSRCGCRCTAGFRHSGRFAICPSSPAAPDATRSRPGEPWAFLWQERLVLVSFGGYGLDGLNLDALSRLNGYVALVSDSVPLADRGDRLGDRSGTGLNLSPSPSPFPLRRTARQPAVRQRTRDVRGRPSL